MNLLTVTLLSAGLLLAAYFLYGGLLQRLFRLDGARVTPAVEMVLVALAGLLLIEMFVVLARRRPVAEAEALPAAAALADGGEPEA